MNIEHLSDEELDRLLCGDALPAERAEHLAACLVCHRRRDGFLGLVEMARGADPGDATRARVRAAALIRWGAGHGRRWVRWVGAAAAAILLGLVPLLRSHLGTQPPINPDRVLVEVDRILDRDPLDDVASRDVVDALVPAAGHGVEGSTS